MKAVPSDAGAEGPGGTSLGFGFGVQSPLLHSGPGVRDLTIEKFELLVAQIYFIDIKRPKSIFYIYISKWRVTSTPYGVYNLGES